MRVMRPKKSEDSFWWGWYASTATTGRVSAHGAGATRLVAKSVTASVEALHCRS